MYNIFMTKAAIFQLCIIASGESYSSVQNVTIRSPNNCNIANIDPAGEWVFNMTLSDWVNCNGNDANWTVRTVTSDKRPFLSVQTVNERRNITARLQSPLLNATRQHQYLIEIDILQDTNDSSILSVYLQKMDQLFFIWTARRVGEVCILIPFNCCACEHNQFRIILEENYTYDPSSGSRYQIMIGYIKYYKSRKLLNSTSFLNATTNISPSAADSHLSQHCTFHDISFYTTTADGRQSSTSVFNHKNNNCFSTSCGALSIALGVGLPLLIVVIIAIILSCYRSESTKTNCLLKFKKENARPITTISFHPTQMASHHLETNPSKASTSDTTGNIILPPNDSVQQTDANSTQSGASKDAVASGEAGSYGHDQKYFPELKSQGEGVYNILHEIHLTPSKSSDDQNIYHHLHKATEYSTINFDTNVLAIKVDPSTYNHLQ